MIFEHTKEQSLLREVARDFTDSEILTSAREREEKKRLDLALMFDRLADPGLTGIILPQEYGAAAAGSIRYAVAGEKISRVCASNGSTLSARFFDGCNPIFLFGNEPHAEPFCCPTCTGSEDRALWPQQNFCRLRWRVQ